MQRQNDRKFADIIFKIFSSMKIVIKYLTLIMLNCFKDYEIHIHILNRKFDLAWYM